MEIDHAGNSRSLKQKKMGQIVLSPYLVRDALLYWHSNLADVLQNKHLGALDPSDSRHFLRNFDLLTFVYNRPKIVLLVFCCISRWDIGIYFVISHARIKEKMNSFPAVYFHDFTTSYWTQLVAHRKNSSLVIILIQTAVRLDVSSHTQFKSWSHNCSETASVVSRRWDNEVIWLPAPQSEILTRGCSNPDSPWISSLLCCSLFARKLIGTPNCIYRNHKDVEVVR